jgi:undecaprenyl diphosphate synthase
METQKPLAKKVSVLQTLHVACCRLRPPRANWRPLPGQRRSCSFLECLKSTNVSTMGAISDKTGSYPQHVAIIMDGNGRWAQERGAIASLGHKAGIDALQRTIEGCVELGVKYLSVFALSTENSTTRSAEEVTFLIRLVRSVVTEQLDMLHQEGVRLKFIGDILGIGDDELTRTIQAAEALTESNDTLVLTVALNFSGHKDLVKSTIHIAKLVLNGSIGLEEIDTDLVSDSLSLSHIARPQRDPDLLIRTGGEQRISNFMLWQLAYSELYFTNVYWPDFDLDELRIACEDFSLRERRFGRRIFS